MKADADQPAMSFPEVGRSLGDKWKKMSGMSQR